MHLHHAEDLSYQRVLMTTSERDRTDGAPEWRLRLRCLLARIYAVVLIVVRRP